MNRRNLEQQKFSSRQFLRSERTAFRAWLKSAQNILWVITRQTKNDGSYRTIKSAEGVYHRRVTVGAREGYTAPKITCPQMADARGF